MSTNFCDRGYRVFSQNEEDGLISHLITQVPIENEIFVEFGSSDYKESNTRYLCEEKKWSGLIFDQNLRSVWDARNDPVYWQRNLKIDCASLDCDNIEDMLRWHGLPLRIGLLSIDIDGNDYWIWKEITCIHPTIVVIEYNAHFGPINDVSVPYDPTRVWAFGRMGWYQGASLCALSRLGKDKGYALIGTERHGVNAFFVRYDALGELQELTPEEAYHGRGDYTLIPYTEKWPIYDFPTDNTIFYRDALYTQ